MDAAGQIWAARLFFSWVAPPFRFCGAPPRFGEEKKKEIRGAVFSWCNLKKHEPCIAVGSRHKSNPSFSYPLLSWPSFNIYFRPKLSGFVDPSQMVLFLLWMDEIRSHHMETMGNHCLLVLTAESSFPSFLRRCRISSIHSVSYNPPKPTNVLDLPRIFRIHHQTRKAL